MANYPTTSPVSAVRQGKCGAAELYDLSTDVGKQRDLSKAMHAKTDDLRQLLHEWRDSINAALPAPNPARKPEK